MSAVPAERRALTPTEVDAVVRGFSAADWTRVRSMARNLGQGLPGWQPDDLLQDTLMRLLQGSRVWWSDLHPMVVLATAMHGVASNRRRKDVRVDPNVVVANVELDDDRDQPGREVMARDDQTPEDSAIADDLVRQLETVCEADDDLQSLLLVWLDGLRGAEAAQALGWDEKKHDAARNKLTRRLVKAGIERS